MKKFLLTKEHLDTFDDTSSAPLLVIMFGFVLFLVIVNISLSTITANYIADVFNLEPFTVRMITISGSILIMSSPYMEYTFRRTERQEFEEKLFKTMKTATMAMISSIAVATVCAILGSGFVVGSKQSATWSNLFLHVFLEAMNLGIDFIAGNMLMIKVQVLMSRDVKTVKVEEVKEEKPANTEKKPTNLSSSIVPTTEKK